MGEVFFLFNFFTFLFVLYIKVFYICNHYNFIGMKQTAGKHLAFLFGRFSKYDVRAYFVAYHSCEVIHHVLHSPPFLLPTVSEYPVVGDDKEGYVSNELIHRSLGD